jgi:hypothetical protein
MPSSSFPISPLLYTFCSVLPSNIWNSAQGCWSFYFPNVQIATGYGLDDRGVVVRVPVGVKIFTSPNRPDQLWGPPNRLSNGYRWLFLRG